MNRSEIEAFVTREDVKEFLARVREFKGEKRAVTGAELTIPEVMLELLRDNLYRYSKLITKIRVRTVGGKARQNIMGAVPEGIWTEAVGKLNELSIGFNQVEVDGYKVGGYIAIPNSTLRIATELAMKFWTSWQTVLQWTRQSCMDWREDAHRYQPACPTVQWQWGERSRTDTQHNQPEVRPAWYDFEEFFSEFCCIWAARPNYSREDAGQ